MFTDPDVVAATAQMVQALSARVSEAPNLVGMSLGNEVNQFSASNHPDPDELTVEQAEDWTGAMFEAARLGAPAGMRTGAPSRRSEEHTSELQSRGHIVCRLSLEKIKI